VRAATYLGDIDAKSDDHRRAGEPEPQHDIDARSLADTVADGVTLADRESHADSCPRDTAAGARPVLRGRRRADTGA
jgi:hypothetical protein